MSDEPASPGSKRAMVVAGSVLGVFVLVCGGGGLLAAAGAGVWWYETQATGLRFSQERVDLEGPAHLPMPTPLVVRRYGEPAPAEQPVTWTVSPSSLARIEGGSLVPSEPGEGTLQACTEEVCATLPLTVALADELTTSLTSVEARVWKPIQIQATARLRGAETHPPLRWSSSDAGVASVDEHGLVTPKGPGKAEIRVEGGGASATVPLAVYAEPPQDCTLAHYADTLGRVGDRNEHRQCQSGDSDMCEWSSSQKLADGGRIDEGGGWEWAWSTLWIPTTDLDQAWAVAQRCLELPPEITALSIPDMLRSRIPAKQSITLSGEWDDDNPAATIDHRLGHLSLELPSACYSSREISVEGRWVKLGFSEGC